MREESRERKKKNNKGFSLVELIIVIAIMAILVAILAPQFLKYVERSRNTADVANGREITNAVIAYIADTEVEGNIITGNDTVVEVTGTETKVSGTSATAVLAALKEAGITTGTSSPLKDVKCKSKTAWTSYKITVGVDAQGVITFKYAGDGGSNNDAFAAAFQQGTGTVSG